MGRSVEKKGDNVVYFDCLYMHENDDGYEWQDLVDNLQCELAAKYKSLFKVKKWIPYPYRENRIILENDHIQISISEYCGCGAASVFVNPESEYLELAEHWLGQNFAGIKKIIKQFVSPLIHIGAFSNGEAIFRKG